MAAYSTLLSLENILYQINHYRFATSYQKDQIKSLVKGVVSFQSFLEDFPERAKNLETRIRDVAAEAEDIFDWFLDEQIQSSNGYYNKSIAFPRGKFQTLQDVKDEMDSIAAEVMEISMKTEDKQLDDDSAGASSSSQVADTREIDAVGFNEYLVEIKENPRNAFDDQSSMKIKDKQLDDHSVGAGSSSQVADTGESNVAGVNKDLIEIKKKLCGSEPELQVVPISGMGGIGKTTLARKAYDDPYIMEHFKIRVWIKVSQKYSKRRILLDLLDSVKEFDQEASNKLIKSSEETPELSDSQKELKVHQILLVRRFLIVMDDVWSIKVLDDVKHFFPNTNNGSRIMLTTRQKEVAMHNANSSTLSHEMHLMNADESWNLLWQKVFIHQYHIPHELESIGREIARSCRGLPLAIVVIAGLLSTTSKTLTSWEEVARNVPSLAAADEQIEKILSLSYNHLPQRLRPCFLYMGGFPEDSEIKVAHLIRLWIAESFVKQVVSKTFEDTAEEYLEDLVHRSLIVVTKRKPNGKIKSCSLHDIVREMCIKLSHKEKFLVQVSGEEELLKSMKDQRRISISNPYLYSLTNFCSSAIRTVIYCEDTLVSFGSFRLLRVLDLLRAERQLEMLSDQFFMLFHLRYLAFCQSSSIPKTISYLKGLQTLVIQNISDSCVPHEIWSMQQLRHLIVSNSCLADPNGDTPPLENLQTLKVRNLTCSVSTMNLVPNITKLWVLYAWGSAELLFHNLVHLTRLEKLHLQQGTAWHGTGKPNLVVPSSLKRLTLVGWGRGDVYLDIVGPFPCLEVLKLKFFNFTPEVWSTDDEQFPQLKYLLIEKSNLKQWDTESSHFPRLKSLLIHSCDYLSEIPECMVDIPTLELIELKYCKESLAESARNIQEEKQSYGDDAFQVRYIDRMPREEPLPSSSNDLVARVQPRQRFVSVEESVDNEYFAVQMGVTLVLAENFLSRYPPPSLKQEDEEEL